MDPAAADWERARYAATVSASSGLQPSGRFVGLQVPYGLTDASAIASSVMFNSSSQMQQHQSLLNVNVSSHAASAQQVFSGSPLSMAQLEQKTLRTSFPGVDVAPGVVPPMSGRSYFPPQQPSGFATSQHLQSQTLAMQNMTSAAQTFSPTLPSLQQFPVPQSAPVPSSLQLVSHLALPGMPHQQMEAQQHQFQQHQLQQQMQQQMQQHQVRLFLFG